MEDYGDFLKHHRLRLLRYLDGIAPESSDELDSLSYVELVLDEWSASFASKSLPEASDEERTFWFALYQLEELIEYSVEGAPDPYEAVLMKNLAEAREPLRANQPLLQGFMATRPNGD